MFNLFTRRKRPNIIFLLLDQIRNDARGCHPVFEKLKRKGVLFSEMVTYAPYTTASLPAMLSGLYGNQNGVNAYMKAGCFDWQNCYTLQQYLQDCDYYTQADTFRKILIPERGFDDILVYERNDEDGLNNTFLVQRHKNMVQELFSYGKGFFLFMHHGLVHKMVVENVIRKYSDFDENYFGRIKENSQRYNRYVHEAGNYLEELLKFLESSDLYGNSLIIVTTDHGCSLGEKPGEKAYGIYTYDYSIKTWAYFIYPPFFKCGQEITKQVRTIDIVPTLLDILNIPESRNYKRIQGRSLLPYVDGKEVRNREAFVETGGLDGPHPSAYEPNVKCVRTGDWKLIYNTTTGQKELYDLRNDAGEENNLYGQNPEVGQRLWTSLTKYDSTGH